MAQITATSFSEVNQQPSASTASTATERTDVPAGVYTCVLEKVQDKTTRNGRPMRTFWFKVKYGSYAGRVMFANFLLDTAKGEEIADTIGSKLESFGALHGEATDKNVEFSVKKSIKPGKNPGVTFDNYFITEA